MKDLMELVKEKLAAAEATGGTTNSAIFKPAAGEQTIRISPSSDGDSFQERFIHYGIGKQSFLCPKKNFGEACAVCDFASELYKEGTDESRATSSKIYAKPRYFSPVLLRGEEEHGIRWWQYSKKVYLTLLKMIMNPKFGNFTDINKGFDFTLTYTPGKGESFADTTLMPDPSSFKTPLVEDAKKAEELVDAMPKINTVLTRVSSEEAQKRLDEYLSADTKSTASSETTKYGSSGGSEIDNAFEQLKNE